MEQRRSKAKGLVWVFLLLIGCAAPPVRMTSWVNLGSVSRIAVLPFDNLSMELNAGERVTHVFIAALHRRHLAHILELGEVERFLIRNRIRSTGQIDLRLLRAMGYELGVDAVLLGIVDEYGYQPMAGEQIPVVGVTIRLLDVQTGNILLAGSLSRTGVDTETVFGLGRIRSLTQLTDEVCNQLADSMARRFPRRFFPTKEFSWIKSAGSDEPPAEEELVPLPEPTRTGGEQETSPTLLEEIEKERSREDSRRRSREWYEEIKRRREAARTTQ